MIKQLVMWYFIISIFYNVQYIRQPLHKQFIVRWTKQFSYTSLFGIYIGICPRSAIRSSRKDALEHNGWGVTHHTKSLSEPAIRPLQSKQTRGEQYDLVVKIHSCSPSNLVVIYPRNVIRPGRKDKLEYKAKGLTLSYKEFLTAH